MEPAEILPPALLIAALALVAFLAARSARDGRSLRRRRLGLEDRAREADAARGPANRLDSAFEDLLREVDLGLGPVGVQLLLFGAGLAGSAAFVYLARAEWAALLGFPIGLAVPLGALIFLRGRRRRRLREELPDALYLMARSIRAGLSLEQALAIGGREGGGPLAQELGHCSEQVGLGLSVPDALRGSARRTRLIDLDLLASVTSLQQATGGNLPKLLDRMAAGARDRNQFLGYLRAQTGMARASAAFIALGQPVLLGAYALSQPEFLAQFFASPFGRAAFAASVALEVIGLVWIALLIRTD